MKKIFSKNINLEKALPYIFIIGGILGVIASFALTYDKIQILQNPNYVPNCNINPIFSCGSVMKTEQANLFGVPNTIFGIMGYTALITFGILMASGAKFKRIIWIIAQFMASIGLIFMHYLFFQGVYRIGAICPWCFSIWMITIPIFWYLTLYNLREGYIKLPKKIISWNGFLQRNHGNILIIWYLIIFVILLNHFWYYWSSLV